MNLKWLEAWYKNNCNGSWEHSYGIRIDTLDNPGWGIRIDLVDTELKNKFFESLKIERSKDDWVHCKVSDYVSKGQEEQRISKKY
ncbi:immunity 53 family protein [Lucifera butyrica]|nr:immunity 53 family protein [Lucifera butyrica]